MTRPRADFIAESWKMRPPELVEPGRVSTSGIRRARSHSRPSSLRRSELFEKCFRVEHVDRGPLQPTVVLGLAKRPNSALAGSAATAAHAASYEADSSGSEVTHIPRSRSNPSRRP